MAVPPTNAVKAPKLVVDSVGKTFFKSVKNEVIGIPALSGVDLSVAKGDFVSVIGPSGCGKSTLLRIIDGLIQPDQGRVLVDGKEICGPGLDRAVVFQYFGLYPGGQSCATSSSASSSRACEPTSGTGSRPRTSRRLVCGGSSIITHTNLVAACDNGWAWRAHSL